MRPLLLFIALAVSMQGVVLDKIAIVVDHRVITEFQLDEEIRVTALLNHKPIEQDLDTRRAAADRLVEQELVRHEVELNQYPAPSPREVEPLLEATESEFGGKASLAAAMQRDRVNEQILREHLRLQLMILKFIDVRFRPDVEVSDSDVEAYYRQELAEWPKTHTGKPPSLEDSRASIVKKLTDERSDYALSSWIEETRKQVDIIYLDKDLD
jgi:hypothetical protein